MAQLHLRGLDDRLVRALNQRAARAGRSAAAEHRAILTQVLITEAERFAEAAARMRATMRLFSPTSAEIIRADRDRDHLDKSE